MIIKRRRRRFCKGIKTERGDYWEKWKTVEERILNELSSFIGKALSVSEQSSWFTKFLLSSHIGKASIASITLKDEKLRKTVMEAFLENERRTKLRELFGKIKDEKNVEELKTHILKLILTSISIQWP